MFSLFAADYYQPAAVSTIQQLVGAGGGERLVLVAS